MQFPRGGMALTMMTRTSLRSHTPNSRLHQFVASKPFKNDEAQQISNYAFVLVALRMLLLVAHTEMVLVLPIADDNARKRTLAPGVIVRVHVIV